MRLSRPVGLALATAGLLVLPGVPYAAADTTVVVDSPAVLTQDLPYGLFQNSCTSPNGDLPTGWQPQGIYIQAGPAPVPSGTHTWGFDFGGQPTGGAIGPFQFHDDISTVTTAQAAFYSDTGTATGVAFSAIATENTNNDFWVGISPVSIAAGGWHTVSAIGLTYTWQEVDGQSGANIGSPVSHTVPALLTAIGTGDHPGEYALEFGCNSPGLVHFDDAQFGPAGDVTTYDFETAATKTSIKASPKTVTAGKAVTLKGVMTDIHGGLFEQETLNLQAKPTGSKTWKTIGHADEHATDTTEEPAVLKEKPTVTTQYRWVYPGAESAPGSTSKALTVKVRTAVTAKPSSKTVKKGGTITVKGKVSPKKAHATITLMKGSKKIGSAKTKANGSYTVKAKATTAGSWKLHTAIGATKGNVAGKSPTFTVKVGASRTRSPIHVRRSSHLAPARTTTPHSSGDTVSTAAKPGGLLAWQRFSVVRTIAP